MILRILATGILAAVAAPNLVAQKSDITPKPTLVVFITVDQMRGDYPARFQKNLTGGLKRLMSGGAFFL